LVLTEEVIKKDKRYYYKNDEVKVMKFKRNGIAQYQPFYPFKKVVLKNGNIKFINKADLKKEKRKKFWIFNETFYTYEGKEIRFLRYKKGDIIEGKLIVQKSRRRYTEIAKFSYASLKKKTFIFNNFREAWVQGEYFGYYLKNSILTSVISTILQLILAIGAAFAFARLEFPFKETIFTLFLATMMIPSQMLLIPNYIIISKIGLYNKLWGIIIPWIANVTNIFLLRQFFKSIPNDLFDSVRIDGGGMLHGIWHIAIPLSKPILITTGLFSFIFQWNSFIWVLIITNDPKIQTLQVGLSNFSQAFGTDWNLLMAASTIVILPLVVLYFFVQKRIIESLARSGLKG
ncbi:carbohydrate ABC transporter permease, partial [bacterium]|nr:carbohydrate ABC transporter permease [bacterium]